MIGADGTRGGIVFAGVAADVVVIAGTVQAAENVPVAESVQGVSIAANHATIGANAVIVANERVTIRSRAVMGVIDLRAIFATRCARSNGSAATCGACWTR